MIVRYLDQAEATERRVVCPQGNWESTRLLLRDDQMGFSFHITTIYAGKSFRLHYTNHLESVYCISGEGAIRTLADDQTYRIRPGMVYALDQHDEHILTADTELKLACVFNPPVTGREVHNKDGAYELVE
jgi:L-ectoine synthase